MRTAAEFATGVVPFFESPVDDPLKRAILSDIAALIDRGDFANGQAVAEFEAAFADYCRTARCIAVASGLDALRLALLATGIERGDEVVVPAQTFAATFEAVTQAGGRPLVVDVHESDYTLDATLAAEVVNPRTRLLLPVHLFGQMADIRRLRREAERSRLVLVEDACQAHGAERDGIRAGAGGVAAAFSFYPAKNLGAFGDAGAVVTDDEEVERRIRALREHGQSAKCVHELEGYTSRLDTIQALVLLRKLEFLDEWNDGRRVAARVYSEALDGVGDLTLPRAAAGSRPVWHLYVVRTADPEALAAFLGQRGVTTARHYPQPPHLSPAYAWLGHREGSFPVAERLARESLSLPLFPGISEARLAAVVDAVRDFFDG